MQNESGIRSDKKWQKLDVCTHPALTTQVKQDSNPRQYLFHFPALPVELFTRAVGTLLQPIPDLNPKSVQARLVPSP